MATTAGSLIVKIGAEIRDFEKNLSKADRMLVKTADSMSAAGKRMTLALTGPILAVGAGMAKMAADAEESASKFQSVFGKNAKAMDAWIQSVRRSIPQTTAQLRDVTSSVQALLVPMGMTTQAAMALGKQFTVLGADLASFYNMPVEEALTGLRSALVGEYEPMRRFGVALSAATVEQEAFRLGLARTKAEVTANVKAQAAWSIIMRSTTMAQGDAARTANSTANQMKFAKANAEEAAHAFGQVLTPALGATARFMANLGRTLADTSTATKGMIVTIAAIAAAIGPVTWAVGGMIAGFVKLKAAVAGLTTILGMAGIGGMLATGGAIVVGLTLLGTLIWKSGEAARKAKRELEGYKLAIAGVTDPAALGQQIAGLEQARSQYGSALSAKRAQRDAIPADAINRIANPNAPGTFIEVPARQRLDREVAQLERNLATINSQLDLSRKHQKLLGPASGGAGGVGGGPDDEFQKALAAYHKRNQRSPFDAPLPAMLHSPYEWGMGGINQGAVRQALGGMAAITPGIPGNTNGLAPLGTDAMGRSNVDMSAEFEEMRQKYETATTSMSSRIVTELQAVPASIAQSLAGFLGPVFAKMGAGGATGGMLGSSIGTAIGGALVGPKTGKVVGSLFGPIGGIVGGFVGAGIGSAIGALFGKPKRKADEAADSFNRLARAANHVSESLRNVPAGFKADYWRFMATTPATPGDPTPVQPTPGNPGTGGGGMGPGPIPTASIVVQQMTVVSNDPDDMWRKLRQKAEREASRGGSRALAVAFAG